MMPANVTKVRKKAVTDKHIQPIIITRPMDNLAETNELSARKQPQETITADVNIVYKYDKIIKIMPKTRFSAFLLVNLHIECFTK